MRKALLRNFLLACSFFFVTGGAFAQLSGAYTINAGSPASATNYQNFASAVGDMVSGTRTDGGAANGPAVSGPVTFTVAAGTYNERVDMSIISGVSATNTVTFDGVNAATRIVNWASTSSGDFTWRINGSDHIRIRNLTIRNGGTNVGYGVQLVSGASNVEISDCRIEVDSTASGVYCVPIIGTTYYTTYGYFTDSLLIQDNVIKGGRFGIVLNGQSGFFTPGHEIRNNQITNWYYSGLYFNYTEGVICHGNLFQSSGTYTSARGGYIREDRGIDFQYNRINNVGAYGLYLYRANYLAPLYRSRIANNFIGGDFTTTGTAYGLYSSTGTNIDIWHNSINMDNGGTSCRGLYLVGTSSGIDVRNNSFVSNPTGANGYSFYISSPSYVTAMDYNNYYSNGPNLCYFGGTYANLAALQAGQPTFNANSRSVVANYLGSSDLHTYGAALNNWADNSVPITDDIDGDSRPFSPDPTKDVGADELRLAPFDMDLVQITSPLVVGPGNNTVAVEALNNGSNSLNGLNVTMQYSTDGGTTWPVSQVFTPTNLGAPGNFETFTFTTPWNVTSSGSFTVCVRINPAIPGDPDTQDQVCTSVCTGMSGVYTINSAVATGGTNFQTFGDCAAALNSCGITGPVTINIAAGTYNEYFELGAIPGSSPTNTVTFDGGSVAACTLAYTFNSTNEALIRLNGTDYVRLRNMTMNLAGLYGYGVHLTNQANNNEVTNCEINCNINTTSVYSDPIMMSGQFYYTAGDNGNNNRIEDNILRGGYYGVRMNGISTSAYNTGNRVANNEISQFYNTGVYAIYQANIEIEGNTIVGRNSGGSTSGYGIYAYYQDSAFVINANTIYNIGARGLYLGYGNVSNAGRGTVSNNMIGSTFSGTTCYGMYVYNNRSTDFYHNSLNLGYSNGYALYMTGSQSTGNSIQNNIIAADGGSFGSGLAMYLSSNSIASTIDYNLYYTSGPQLINYSGNQYASLTAWNSVWTQYDQNSLEDPPGFISTNNLHVICSPADGMGTYVGIDSDIDGDARSQSTPDIGADEFVGITVSVDLGQDTTNCGRFVLEVDTNVWSSINWDPGSGSYFYNVDTTTNVIVEVVDSNNCRALDSILVTVLDLPYKPYNNDTITQCSYQDLDAQNAGSSYLWSNSATSQTIVPPTSGTYSVEITSQDGCVQNDTVTVNFFNDALAQLGPDTTFCQGGSAVLDAGNGPNGTSYAWSTGATTQVLVASAQGTYAVTVTSPNGCTATDSVTLNAVQPPVVNLGPDRDECETFLLDAGNIGSTYLWSTGATTQTITGTNSGSYSVTVTNSSGCSSVDQVQLTIGQSPQVNLGPDQTLCNNTSLTLDAGNPGYNYFWSNGATSQTIPVTSGGIYFVEVTNPTTGCSNTDTIFISQSFLQVNLGPDNVLCNNASLMLDAGSGGSTYSWSNGASSQTITVSTAGTYSVTVTDGSGCQATDDIVLSPGTNVTADYSSVTQVPLFQPIAFTDNSTNATSWDWDFGDGNTSNAQNPTHTYLALGTFNVCLTVSDGTCEDTYCTTVEVQAPIGIEDPIFNASIRVFPNPSDGYFQLKFDLSDLTDLRVAVVNLAGQKVYDKELVSVLKQSETVDIRHQASGIYLLMIQAQDGRTKVEKLIIE